MKHSQHVIIHLLLLLSLVFISHGLCEAVDNENNDVSLTGFIDTSYYYTVTTEDYSFGLDQVEFDVEARLSAGTTLRADINFLEADSSDDDSLSFSEIVEQGYITMKCPEMETITFVFGKFNAPIGFESLDPPDMYQYSHALVYDLGAPTNVTGFMVEAGLHELLDLNVYLANGWDNNVETNEEMIAGMRLGIHPFQGFDLGISAIYGAESQDESQDTMVYDIDGSITMIDNLVIGFDYNHGTVTDALGDGKDGEWSGFLLMAHYDFSHLLGFTVRFDQFNDDDGLRTGIAQELTSYTLCLTFTINEQAGFLIDYRHDESDEDVFVDDKGEPVDASDTIALEFIYSFKLL